MIVFRDTSSLIVYLSYVTSKRTAVSFHVRGWCSSACVRDIPFFITLLKITPTRVRTYKLSHLKQLTITCTTLKHLNILEYQHSNTNTGTLQDKVLRRILASCTVVFNLISLSRLTMRIALKSQQHNNPFSCHKKITPKLRKPTLEPTPPGTKLDRYREMLTGISHSDLKAESEYLSLLISSLDEPSDDMQTLSKSQLAKYVVFERTCRSMA